MTYRILSMDGGGMRGVLTAQILVHILQQHDPKFLDSVDLIAGTSAGAINAVALAQDLTPTQLVAFYQKEGPTIFDHSIWHEIGHTWGGLRAKYTEQARMQGLKNAGLDNRPLQNLAKKVLITTFQLDNVSPIPNPGAPQPAWPPSTPPVASETWKTKFFHNFPVDNNGAANPDLTQGSLDVVMRSSAAPVYFPIYQGFIDGGVAANDPSACALAQALNPKTVNVDVRDIKLLSIGTGGNANRVRQWDGDWGVEQWGLTLVDLLVDADVGIAEYQCRQILTDDCFQRVQPDLGKAIGLDDTDAVPKLIAAATTWINSQQGQDFLVWLTNKWQPGP